MCVSLVHHLTNEVLIVTFSRASVWINYFDDRNAIPIPLNIIPSVHTITQGFVWLASCCRKATQKLSFLRGTRKRSWHTKRIMEQEANRSQYSTLIERVFRKAEGNKVQKVSKNDIDALEKEISIDIHEFQRDFHRSGSHKIGQT